MAPFVCHEPAPSPSSHPEPLSSPPCPPFGRAHPPSAAASQIRKVLPVGPATVIRSLLLPQPPLPCPMAVPYCALLTHRAPALRMRVTHCRDPVTDQNTPKRVFRPWPPKTSGKTMVFCAHNVVSDPPSSPVKRGTEPSKSTHARHISVSSAVGARHPQKKPHTSFSRFFSQPLALSSS